MTIDAMDVSGDQQNDVDHNIFKSRLSPDGHLVDDKPQKEGFCLTHSLHFALFANSTLLFLYNSNC